METTWWFPSGRKRAYVLAGVALGLGAAAIFPKFTNSSDAARAEQVEAVVRESGRFYPTQTQWSSFTVEVVGSYAFREELSTEGKIGIDEDRATPVFAPYSGRVSKLLAAPGDQVGSGQPLFILEAADSLQVQNDFITATGALNKARSQVTLADTVEKRVRNLYDAKAAPLKELQLAQAALTDAQNDLQSARSTHEAIRNRLRMLGKTDAEIDRFQHEGAITAEATIFAPLSGTIVQRKLGPGQYVAAGSSDPVFVIGDLSAVWLIAYVRESDSSKIKIGQPLRFSVLAYPNQIFEAKVDYVATSIDPVSRRRMVRATVKNADGKLAPEMFATVTLVVGNEGSSVAVPREAIIYEGSAARIWVARDDNSVEVRNVVLGLNDERRIQVLQGLAQGDRIISKGSLFIDRLAGRS